jgi:hypothetical protein
MDLLALRGLARTALRLAALAGGVLALAAGAAWHAAAPAAAAGTGLVAAYSFDEGSGSVVGDSSGNGNAGSASGTAWAAGKYGNALSFNGTSSFVSVPDSSSLDLTSGMTLEAWVNPSALGTAWRTAVLKEQSPPSELTYALYANTDTTQPAGNVFSGTDQFTSGGSIPLNAWSFLAATYDGSTLRLYVNGTEVGNLPIAGSILASTGPLRIGGNTVWREWFKGSIDDVRVYDRALSAAEVQSDMGRPVTP